MELLPERLLQSDLGEIWHLTSNLCKMAELQRQEGDYRCRRPLEGSPWYKDIDC
jgi:hypothetical protein